MAMLNNQRVCNDLYRHRIIGIASHGLQSFLPGKVLYEGDPVIPGTYDNVTALQCQEPWLSHVGERLEKAKPNGQSIQEFV